MPVGDESFAELLEQDLSPSHVTVHARRANVLITVTYSANLERQDILHLTTDAARQALDAVVLD